MKADYNFLILPQTFQKSAQFYIIFLVNLIFIFRFVSPYFLLQFFFFFFQRRLWTVGGEGRRVEWERWRIQLHLVLRLSIMTGDNTTHCAKDAPSHCSPSFRVLPLYRVLLLL